MSSPDLIKILDLDKFTLREDKFKPGEEGECEKTISWKELDKYKNNPKEYIRVLNQIKTNPKYGKGHGPINHLNSIEIKKKFRY